MPTKKRSRAAKKAVVQDSMTEQEEEDVTYCDRGAKENNSLDDDEEEAEASVEERKVASRRVRSRTRNARVEEEKRPSSTKTVSEKSAIASSSHHRAGTRQRNAVVSDEEDEDYDVDASKPGGLEIDQDLEGDDEEEESPPPKKRRIDESSEEPPEREDSDPRKKATLQKLKRQLAIQQAKSQESEGAAGDYMPSGGKKKGGGKGRPGAKTKGGQRVRNRQAEKKEDSMATGNALQIDMDIEEEDDMAAQHDKQALVVARNRYPRLFEIYDERAALKFKSNHWLRQQVAKKNNNRMIIFKNLKQMLVNFDSSDKPAEYVVNEAQPPFNEELGSFMSIEAGIHVKKPARYCDFTGFKNKFTHKETGIRYTEEYQFYQLEKMPLSKVEEFLSIRKVIQVLK